eukprot:7957547-Alexandrium_andersonii.AAC.1
MQQSSRRRMQQGARATPRGQLFCRSRCKQLETYGRRPCHQSTARTECSSAAPRRRDTPQPRRGVSSMGPIGTAPPHQVPLEGGSGRNLQKPRHASTIHPRIRTHRAQIKWQIVAQCLHAISLRTPRGGQGPRCSAPLARAFRSAMAHGCCTLAALSP